MKAVVLHEYGGPEKLKFEDNVPDPQISGDTVLIAATAIRGAAKGFSVVVPCNSGPRRKRRRTVGGSKCEALQAR